jgi:hypothetical protein
VFAEAHRALVAAGAEAAVEALLAGGAAAPPPAVQGAPLMRPLPSLFGPIEWADIERAARQALLAIREPSPADAVPAVPDGSPRCDVCGKSASAMPGGLPLMRCGGCRGPERWCSKECQRAGWLGAHRKQCKQRQAGVASAAAAASTAATAED